MNNCPVCVEPLNVGPVDRPGRDADDYDCPNCGVYSLSWTLASMLASGAYDVSRRAIISYAIRRIERQDNRPLVTADFARSVVEHGELPNAEQRLENVILYLGRVLPEPGAATNLRPSPMRAEIGCITEAASGWILKQVHDLGLVEGIESKAISAPYQLIQATLSVNGWKMYYELLAGGTTSKRAFMAMKFGDAQMDDVFSSCLKSACKRAGFDLVRLDDEPAAGLIDDRLRLEIRRSKFLVADLSHANPGAYWEAGYAEGLGRPVIYTCRKDVFDDHTKRPHFDTNHHLTVVWDPDDLVAAANLLTTVIRVTLSADAKLDDN